MPSVDGNYLKMQGEALARLQVAYQAEGQAQQVRAQAASEKALVRLREEVLASSSSAGQDRGMAAIGGQEESSSSSDRRRRKGGRTTGAPSPDGEAPRDVGGTGSRLDVRV